MSDWDNSNIFTSLHEIFTEDQIVDLIVIIIIWGFGWFSDDLGWPDWNGGLLNFQRNIWNISDCLYAMEQTLSVVMPRAQDSRSSRKIQRLLTLQMEDVRFNSGIAATTTTWLPTWQLPVRFEQLDRRAEIKRSHNAGYFFFLFFFCFVFFLLLLLIN